MQDWEYTTNELLHYRTKGALNKKVAQYIRDGGKLINGKIVYAKNAISKGIRTAKKKVDDTNTRRELKTKSDSTLKAYDDYVRKRFAKFDKVASEHRKTGVNMRGKDIERQLLERNRKNSGYTGPDFAKETIYQDKDMTVQYNPKGNNYLGYLNRTSKSSKLWNQYDKAHKEYNDYIGTGKKSMQRKLLERSRKNTGYGSTTKLKNSIKRTIAKFKK